MARQIATPYDYGKYTVKITAADGDVVDVSNLVIELNFFESLKDPFVSGTIVIVDSANIFNFVNFLGQERVDITVTDIYNAVKIKKSFAINNIRKQEKTNDTASAYVLSFIDFHAYKDSKQIFSRAYTGKPESILQTIATEQLGINVALRSSSIQSAMRVLTPATDSPLQVMKWLKDRCTTSMGGQFFLHSSLYKQNLQLISINDLLGQGAFNSEPFSYTTPTKTQESLYSRETFESLTYKIATMNFALNQDALQLLNKDAYGSHNHFIDTYEEKTLEGHYSLLEVLGAMPKPNGRDDYIPRNAPGLGEANHSSTANGSYISQVVTKKLFEDLFSYNEEETLDKHLLKSKRHGFKNFVVKGMASFQLPGFAFLGKDLIGQNQIDIFVIKDRPIEENFTKQQIKDKKRSGKYVITNIRNMFKNSQHSVMITGIKIDNDPEIASEQFYKGK